MAEADGIILPLLREMRAENLNEHARTREQVALLEQEMRHMEQRG